MKISLPALIVLLLACFSLDAEAQFRKGLREGGTGFKKGDRVLGSRTAAERLKAMERARGIQARPAEAAPRKAAEEPKADTTPREGAHYHAVMKRYDRDRSGTLSETEAAACQRDRMESIARRETFLKTYDTDGNGEISDAEAAKIPRR